MKYFGIKTPEPHSYIWWIADSQHNSWMSFFTYPSKDGDGPAPHRLPMCDAIRAYKGIGYRCVELEVKEKVVLPSLECVDAAMNDYKNGNYQTIDMIMDEIDNERDD